MIGAVDGQVVVLLPDDWTTLPLDDDTRADSVRALVDRQLGGSPDLQPLRSAMRRELLQQTEHAARAGGVLMALTIGTDGPPSVPASLTVYRVPGSLDERGRTAMIGVLASDEPGHSLDLGAGATGNVLRRVRPARASTGLTGDHQLPALVVDYWVEAVTGAPLVYLVFSSPLVGLRDELLDLFDNIVASVRVLPPSDASELAQEDV